MTSIKELKLSPITYTLLADNGIKTIEGLSRFTEKELIRVKGYQHYCEPDITMEDIVDEIKIKLNRLGIKLGTMNDEKILDTEKRIRELDLPNATIEKLKRNSIITTGVLSTYDEEELSRRYGIGTKTVNDVKKVFSLENKVPHELVVFKDLSEEEKEYYEEQVKLVNESAEINRKKLDEKRKIQEEKRRRARKLLNMKLSELYIPVLKIEGKNSISILTQNKNEEDYTINDLIRLRRDNIKNVFEVENALSRIGINNIIHINMSPKEISRIELTELELNKIEEYRVSRHVEELKKQEQLLELKLKNEKLTEENEFYKKIEEALEKALAKNRELEYENAYLKADIKALAKECGVEIDPNESGQGQHRK